MGRARNRPKVLPDKLLAIRKFLNVGQSEMAQKLQSETPSQSGGQYQVKRSRISEWENGRREPGLFVIIAYVHLRQVHMEPVIDDDVTVEDFRKRLGQEFNFYTSTRDTKA